MDARWCSDGLCTTEESEWPWQSTSFCFYFVFPFQFFDVRFQWFRRAVWYSSFSIQNNLLALSLCSNFDERYSTIRHLFGWAGHVSIMPGSSAFRSPDSRSVYYLDTSFVALLYFIQHWWKNPRFSLTTEARWFWRWPTTRKTQWNAEKSGGTKLSQSNDRTDGNLYS